MNNNDIINKSIYSPKPIINNDYEIRYLNANDADECVSLQSRITADLTTEEIRINLNLKTLDEYKKAVNTQYGGVGFFVKEKLHGQLFASECDDNFLKRLRCRIGELSKNSFAGIEKDELLKIFQDDNNISPKIEIKTAMFDQEYRGALVSIDNNEYMQANKLVFNKLLEKITDTVNKKKNNTLLVSKIATTNIASSKMLDKLGFDKYSDLQGNRSRLFIYLRPLILK